MSDSPNVDQWLTRVNLIGTLLISVAALYMSYRQSDEATRQVTAEVNERMDKVNQTLGTLQERLARAETDQHLVRLREDLSKAETRLAELQKKYATQPDASKLLAFSSQLAQKKESVNDLLTKPSSPLSEIDSRLSSLAALRRQTDQLGLLTPNERKDLNSLLKPPSSYKLDQPKIPTLSYSDLLLPEQPPKMWYESVWDWIKGHVGLTIFIAIILMSILFGKK